MITGPRVTPPDPAVRPPRRTTRALRRLTVLAAGVAVGVVAFVPAAAGAVPSQTVASTTTWAIEHYVQEQAKASHIPGVAVGVVQDNRVVLQTGYGDVDADTPFFLASLSKSFTALAIMQLVDAGKVRLQDPVRTYIPWFTMGTAAQSKAMTVQQVLDQTSGISTEAGLKALTFAPTTTLPQAIKDFESTALVADPGKTFQYSNANYMIAGYIVEQASGQSYEQYVQQHIFAPLDMTRTYALTGSVRAPGLTHGHANWFGAKVPLTEQVAPALVPDGYLISTASDMTHYLIAQMNNGVYNGKAIVSPAAVRLMHSALVPLRGQAPVPNASSYGLGWGAGTINGTSIVSHDGQLRSFQTNMAILPDKRTAVVMLINENGLLLNESRTYDGVLQGVTTGRFPSTSHYFTTYYVVFDLVVLASLLLMTRSLARTGVRLRKFRARAEVRGRKRATFGLVGVDLGIAAVLAAAVFLGIGAATGMVPLTPAVMIFGIPDLSVWLWVVIGFFVLRPVVRLLTLAVAENRGAEGRSLLGGQPA